MARNLNINYGEFILKELLKKIGKLETHSLLQFDVKCVYPRFIQLILNEILSEDDKSYFYTSTVLPYFTMGTNVSSYIVTRDIFANVPVELTSFTQTRFNQPLLPDNAFINEQGEIIIHEQEQPPRGEAGIQDIPIEQLELPPQGEVGNHDLDISFTEMITVEPSVALGQDQGIENLQSLKQIIEPNTQIDTTPSTQPLEKKPCQMKRVRESVPLVH